jgi:mono/diheme cytochrome c family protein
LADFKDERAYDSKTLTKVFLWSSLALLLCVGWMAWDDYSKKWKDYQRTFMKMERLKAKESLREAKGEVDLARYKQLKAELKEAVRELKAHRGEISKLESTRAKLDASIYETNMVYQTTKAHIDKEKFEYSEHTLKQGKQDPKKKKKIDELTDEADRLNRKLFDDRRASEEAGKGLAAIYAKRDEIGNKIKVMRKDVDFLQAKIKNLDLNWFFYLRNAMLLDFMAPTIQIKQIVLANLPEDLYFAKTMRVDRCTSCHLGIDKKGYEDAPHPYKTHPRLDLYVGSTSPHGLDKVGCTVCHGGVGPALDFNMCAHVTTDKAKAKKWKKNHGWHEPHGIEGPMVPLQYTEGSCLKCHGMQEHVNAAPKLNHGRELMVTHGCVGCHKVKNLENLPKAGPGLLKVKGKLKRDFVEKWIWNPRSFNPKARMPSFFQQTNNDDPESLSKTKAELKALVDYLWDHSGDYTPSGSPSGGSVSNGKKLFKETGCMACHGIEDVTSHHPSFGPDLSGTGSKLSASFVYTWIRNPRHYDTETRMPSLRLSNEEASDITAYLMSKRNKDFEEMSPPEAEAAVRDALIVDYLKVKVGLKDASVTLAQMDEKAKDLFLGQKTMNKYGCFGCHTIQGFETAQGIGTELTEWASKRVNQLDFGFIDMHHSHDSFILAKLENPRQFDKDKVTAFGDKLKMPNFYFSEEEKEAVATAVLGLTKTYIPDGMTAGIHGSGPLLEKGRRVINKFNCRGCHLIEDMGGKIKDMYAKESWDPNTAPPNLRKIGARVQVGFLHDFLTDVKPIRRNMKARMPSFHWTDNDLSALITYANLKEDQVFPYDSMRTTALFGNDLAEAKALFNKLQCQKCHMVGGRMPVDPTSTAPDLVKVKGRLKPDWVVEWLKNPDALSPGTPMPPMWPDDETAPRSPGGAAKKLPADPKLLGGDAKRQMEAIRDYLYMLAGSSAEAPEKDKKKKK